MESRESCGATGQSPKPGMGRRIDQFSALIWLAVGAVVVQQATGMEYMSKYGPGAGFFPFWLGVAVMAGSIGLFAEATHLRGGKGAVSVPTRQAAIQMLLVIVAFFGFVYLADKAGFLVSVGLLFLFLLRVVERRGWRLSLSITAASVLILWAIFEFGLKLRLPKGFLGYWF